MSLTFNLGYYFVPNLQYAPTNWIQLDTIYSALDALLEPFKSPSSLEKMHHLLTHTGQHLVGFFYNTYLITYKVALRAMESKRVMMLRDWELEDHAFGFFIANIISFAIIDWHPVTINVFVEEPGRVKHWQAYKVEWNIYIPLFFANTCCVKKKR
jgi:hypothetical protein